MRYDLAALMAMAAPHRRGPVLLRPLSPPRGLYSDLLAALRPALAWLRQGGVRLLAAVADSPPLITDGVSDRVRSVVQALQAEEPGQLEAILPRIRQWAARSELWHREQFVRAVRQRTGVDISLLVWGHDAGDILRAHGEWASGLVRGATQDARRRLESAAYAALVAGSPKTLLAREVANILNTTRRRAMFIAHDQTVKLAARLEQLRQQEAGIDRYRWRHSGSPHPRLHHVARDNKVFRWDRPPPDGHPRTQPNCGCLPEALVA